VPAFQNTVSSIFIGEYLPAYEDGTDRVFRNVGTQTTGAGESPRRKHMTFRTRQKFEIEKSAVIHDRKYVAISRLCDEG
jgi:hypothetical protein